MRLSYKAVTKEGKIITGIIEAKDASEAGSYLRTRNILPIHIVASNSGDIIKLLPFLDKVNNGDIVFFTRQLSSMLGSGLTLIQALNIFKEQVQKESVTEMVRGIIADMEDGRSFSQAIEKYPDTFSPIYVSLIKAAEESGLLEKIMDRLAENLERQQALKGTIKSALMYPMIIIIGMIGVMGIMMFVVIPQLTTLYTSLNVSLPVTTQIIVAISTFTINYWPIVIALFLLLAFFYRRLRKSQSGRILLDNVFLKLPVFGNLITKSILGEFSRTFGLMVGSGTLVVDSLVKVSDIVGNELYKNAIIDVSKRVEKGISVGDAMESYPLFPPMLVQMVKIGEQTGKLDESLLKVSEYYEREVSQATKTLTTALEPIILVILGGGVGFLIISVITPIYSLINAIK